MFSYYYSTPLFLYHFNAVICQNRCYDHHCRFLVPVHLTVHLTFVEPVCNSVQVHSIVKVHCFVKNSRVEPLFRAIVLPFACFESSTVEHPIDYCFVIGLLKLYPTIYQG
jgi:hypothetical protein